MSVCYDKLFSLMLDRNITKTQFKNKACISANIVTRLNRNEYISMESIEKICRALNCCVDEILDFIPDEKR